MGARDRAHEPNWSARADELLRWPRGIARLAVVLCTVVAVSLLIYEVPKTVVDLGRDADRTASLSYADREIAGGNSILVDQIAAYEARALIPVTTTFRVVTGPNMTKTTPLTLPAVSGWLTYFLVPRRQVGDAAWVVCYGCDHEKLGGAYHELWHDEFGISIGRVG